MVLLKLNYCNRNKSEFVGCARKLSFYTELCSANFMTYYQHVLAIVISSRAPVSSKEKSVNNIKIDITDPWEQNF